MRRIYGFDKLKVLLVGAKKTDQDDRIRQRSTEQYDN